MGDYGAPPLPIEASLPGVPGFEDAAPPPPVKGGVGEYTGPKFDAIDRKQYPQLGLDKLPSSFSVYYWRVMKKICAGSIVPFAGDSRTDDRLVVILGDQVMMTTLRGGVKRICRLDDIRAMARMHLPGSAAMLAVQFTGHPPGTFEPSWKLRIVEDMRTEKTHRDFCEVVNFLRHRKGLPQVPVSILKKKSDFVQYGPYKRDKSTVTTKQKQANWATQLMPQTSLARLETEERAATAAAAQSPAGPLEANRPPPLDLGYNGNSAGDAAAADQAPPNMNPGMQADLEYAAPQDNFTGTADRTSPHKDSGYPAAATSFPAAAAAPRYNTGDEVSYGGFAGLVIGTFDDGVHVSFPMAYGIQSIPEDQLSPSNQGLQWEDVCLPVTIDADYPDQKLGIVYDKDLVAKEVDPTGLGAACGVQLDRKLISIDSARVESPEDARHVLSKLNSSTYGLVFSEVLRTEGVMPAAPYHAAAEYPDEVGVAPYTAQEFPSREAELEGALALTRQTLKGVHGRLKDTIAERDAAIKLTHQLRRSLDSKELQIRCSDSPKQRRRARRAERGSAQQYSKQRRGSPRQRDDGQSTSPSSGSSVGRAVLANPIAIELAPVYGTRPFQQTAKPSPATAHHPHAANALMPHAATSSRSPFAHGLHGHPSQSRAEPHIYPAAGDLRNAPTLAPINATQSPPRAAHHGGYPIVAIPPVHGSQTPYFQSLL
eukprot:TRINITY_DN8439_c0_g2_i1.p1 TRINITY_DN8439_c0_g2~~TRINITY_DN8439_c0_g2_i1.p1  ORF type:complete len:726 (+),score=23.98 TRINITY_DN8439_c0_g2_i1:46-2178(+)